MSNQKLSPTRPRVAPKAHLPRHSNLRRLAGAGLELADVILPADGALVGFPVAQLFMVHPDAIPVAIQRGQTLLHPRGDARLKAGDHVYAIVSTTTLPAWLAAVTRATQSDGFLRLPHRDLGPRVPGGL